MTQLVIFIILAVIILIGFFGAMLYFNYKDSNKEVYYIAFCSDKEGTKEYGNSRTIYSTFEDAEAEDFLVVKTKKKRDI